MKDLCLAFVLVAAVLFGYFLMTRVHRLIDENQMLIDDTVREGQKKVRIAAEEPGLLDCVADTLARCSEADPYLDFFLSCGRAGQLMEKLAAGQIDILLLSGDCTGQEGEGFAALRIPRRAGGSVRSRLGLRVEEQEGEEWFRVVWKRDGAEYGRDRVIFALENRFCSVSCGYPDYLDR